MSYVIAEAGINHCGDLEAAKAMITDANDAGADYIKFQMFDPKVIGIDPKYAFDFGQMIELSDYCHDERIKMGVSVFDPKSAEKAIELTPNFIKIPSGNHDYWDLLDAVKEYPYVIYSTGMAQYEDILAMMQTRRFMTRDNTVILHCVSAYPTPYSDINLNNMETLRRMFPCEVGYSDHTTGPYAAIVAATMGADWVEKHMMCSKMPPSSQPDAEVSVLPEGFAMMCEGIKAALLSQGSPMRRIQISERRTMMMMNDRRANRGAEPMELPVIQ